MLEDPLKLLLKGSAVSNLWFGVRPPVKGMFGGSWDPLQNSISYGGKFGVKSKKAKNPIIQ